MTGATVRWLGHATIELTLQDARVILIDPWLTDNPSCPEADKEPTRCDIIALTHGHFDHVGDVARLVDRFDPHIVGILELCDIIGRERPKAKFAPMNIGGTQTVDGIEFTLTRAYHSSSVSSESGPQYAGMPCGVIVNAEDVASFYHVGDTDVFGDMKIIAELFAPKIAAIPMGDHFTMGPKGAAMAAGFLRPEVILPIHYGTFPMLHGTPDAFRDALDADLKDRLIVPKIGETMAWSAGGLSLIE